MPKSLQLAQRTVKPVPWTVATTTIVAGTSVPAIEFVACYHVALLPVVTAIAKTVAATRALVAKLARAIVTIVVAIIELAATAADQSLESDADCWEEFVIGSVEIDAVKALVATHHVATLAVQSPIRMCHRRRRH